MLDLDLPQHSYLLGFLLGDGHLSSGPGRKGRLTIEVAARDGELLDRLAVLLPGARRSARVRRTNFAERSSTSLLLWCRMDVRAAMAEEGMPVGRKDTLIEPPARSFVARDFARGLVDADGSLGFTAAGYPFVSLVTTSPAMALWWCDLLHRKTGVSRSVRPNARDGAINVMVQREHASELAGWLYREGDLALARKSESAMQVAAWARPAGMRAASQCRRPWTSDEDAQVLRDVPVAELAVELSPVRRRPWWPAVGGCVTDRCPEGRPRAPDADVRGAPSFGPTWSAAASPEQP